MTDAEIAACREQATKPPPAPPAAPPLTAGTRAEPAPATRGGAVDAAALQQRREQFEEALELANNPAFALADRIRAAAPPGLAIEDITPAGDRLAIRGAGGEAQIARFLANLGKTGALREPNLVNTYRREDGQAGFVIEGDAP